MTTKNYSTLLLLAASISMDGCQTTTTTPSKDAPQYENIITLKADIDSDGDGVLDEIDECPETPLHTIVDVKGCEIIIEGGEALEMEFNGFFPPMSSQLPAIYDADFIKMAEKLNEYPDANVFIFGHVASNEVTKDSLATFGFESLPRNRALIVKNMLVLEHNIASERIHTYDCSNKYLAIDTDALDRNFEALNLKNIESKDSRVTLLASTEVNDLMDLEYVSYTRKYGEYAKRCENFE